MITQERLKELVDYSPINGKFIAKCSVGRVKKGTELGCFDKARGYIVIRLDSTLYQAHLLAWLYVYGEYPELLDHKDTNKTNNTILNLRLATKSQNGMNSLVRIDSTTGIKGIVWEERANGFQARVVLDRKNYTRRFSCKKYKDKEIALQEAIKWVQCKRNELHGEFANHG
jgi:hypothetical protein